MTRPRLVWYAIHEVGNDGYRVSSVSMPGDSGGEPVVKHKRTECWECGKTKDRCRPVSVQGTDRETVEYVCPQCWRDLEMDAYVKRDQKDT